jgi:hypothetical protein
MKYREVTIKEDRDILADINISKLARELGCDRSYLSLVKNDKEIASFSFYRRIKEKTFKR